MKQPINSFSVLASACLAIMSVSATAAPEPKVPGVIDSSTKRIIRVAKPDAQLSQTQNQPQAPDQNQTAVETNLPIAVNTPTQPQDYASNNTQDSDSNNNAQQSSQQSASTNDAPQPEVLAQQPFIVVDSSKTPGIDLKSGQLTNIPIPRTSVNDASFVTTVLIPQTTSAGEGQLDVSLLDDFIKEVSPNVRHYPPNFPNKSQAYNTREKIKLLTKWIEPYASAPNASYEVLLRAAKLNGMGRNLDLGSDYAVRASNHVAKAISRQPDSVEANFLYGMMLTEGGGFKEGKKYLDKAASQGYMEAEQSLAQSDLLSDRRSDALERLRRLREKHPNDPIIEKQIQLVEDGKYYIWDIPSANINVKPVS